MLADQKAACGPDCIHGKIDNHTASDNDKFLTLTTDLDVSTYVWDIIKGSHRLRSNLVLHYISAQSSARYLAGAVCSASTTDPNISEKLSLNFPESPLNYSGWLALDTKMVTGDEPTHPGDNGILSNHRADIDTEVDIHLSSASFESSPRSFGP
jgi:hypothetical protein